MLLVREFDHRIRAFVEQPFKPAHLALRVLPHRVRDVDVLALYDRPHG
jgi:hypothetical protein